MNLTVRSGPREYICELGVLEQLTEKLEANNVTKAVLVHGEVSWQKAQSFLSLFLNSAIDIEFVSFNGECSYKEVGRVASIAKKVGADSIIGIGGGKLVDTVKYASFKVGQVFSVIIPTLASNCAPWTPLSVMYENGVNTGFDVHGEQVSLLLIEPQLIIDSPIEYFKAGIGDTIAKWYESDEVLSQDKYAKNVFLHMARQAASACRDNIFNHSQKAVEDFKEGNISEDVILVFETIIAISGLVGGFGDTYARTTLAHDIHDALTIYPNTHHFLHGNKVAYGVFVQLSYEGKWNEIDKLTPFYNDLGLPKTLNELDLSSLTDQDLNELGQKVKNLANSKGSLYITEPLKLEVALKKLEKHFV